jgi:hypothetical protein
MIALPLLVSLLLTGSAPPNGPPSRAGDCQWVHGRFAIYNGSSLRRIWIIGTRRIIALKDDDSELPAEDEQYQQGSASYGGFEDALFGDFYVCAVDASRPGRMQHVRLQRTKNLKFRGKPFPPK